MILSDKTIKELCSSLHNKTLGQKQGLPMIENFISEQVSKIDEKKVISYGLSSYGYDARLSNEFVIYQSPHNDFQAISQSDLKSKYLQSVIDPKNPRNEIIKTIVTNEPVILAPHGFLMGLTIEKFNMPKDVMALCIGKSTYARCGVIINVTPLEPGCSGQVVIEISNTANLPVYIHPGEGICQFLFFKGDAPCDISYRDKIGKYLNQDKIVLPFVM